MRSASSQAKACPKPSPAAKGQAKAKVAPSMKRKNARASLPDPKEDDEDDLPPMTKRSRRCAEQSSPEDDDASQNIDGEPLDDADEYVQDEGVAEDADALVSEPLDELEGVTDVIARASESPKRNTAPSRPLATALPCYRPSLG